MMCSMRRATAGGQRPPLTAAPLAGACVGSARGACKLELRFTASRVHARACMHAEGRAGPRCLRQFAKLGLMSWAWVVSVCARS